MKITDLSKKDGDLFLEVAESKWFEIDPQYSNEYNSLYTGQVISITNIKDKNEYPFLLSDKTSSFKMFMRKVERRNPPVWQE